MGDEEVKKLGKENILVDDGKISEIVVHSFEKLQGITLPKNYVNFIIQHDGASLYADVFDYFDTPRQSVTSNSIAFIKFEKIGRFIEGLLEESVDDKDYFYKNLIPFGDNGGGDFICFDYRKNPKTDNPPIILWSHDVENNSQRISFIANNFEEFINMLYESNDED